MSMTSRLGCRRRIIGGTRTVTPGQLNGCVPAHVLSRAGCTERSSYLPSSYLAYPLRDSLPTCSSIALASRYDNAKPTVQIKPPRPIHPKRRTFGRDHHRRRGRGGCRSRAEEGKVSPLSSRSGGFEEEQAAHSDPALYCICRILTIYDCKIVMSWKGQSSSSPPSFLIGFMRIGKLMIFRLSFCGVADRRYRKDRGGRRGRGKSHRSRGLARDDRWA